MRQIFTRRLGTREKKSPAVVLRTTSDTALLAKRPSPTPTARSLNCRAKNKTGQCEASPLFTRSLRLITATAHQQCTHRYFGCCDFPGQHAKLINVPIADIILIVGVVA